MPWAPDYATVTDLRDFVRIDDAADDAVIEAALSGASRAIDHACDPREGFWRQFGRTDVPEARYFTPSRRGYSAPWRDQWIAVTDDIADPAGTVAVAADLTGDGAYVEITGCVVLPRNAAAQGLPGTSVLFAGSSMPIPPIIAESVRVTTEWGWPAVPPSIHEACLLQTSRLISRRDAPFGVAGSPEVGSEVRLLARLDPDVEQLVRPYVRKIGTVLE
jgi:hypothetical protein